MRLLVQLLSFEGFSGLDLQVLPPRLVPRCHTLMKWMHGLTKSALHANPTHHYTIDARHFASWELTMRWPRCRRHSDEHEAASAAGPWMTWRESYGYFDCCASLLFYSDYFDDDLATCYAPMPFYFC
jgi:hypothetical protein